MSRNRIICGLLILLTLAVYAQVGGFGFIHLDDYDYVCENPHVHTGLNAGNIAWAFTEAHSANWHSLTWLSLMADAQITRWIGGDPTTDAAVFHLTNLILHLANVLLVFAALNLMTRASWRSAIVAALFAVHPIHVESVAWIAERKDVLSTLMWWLTILAYAKYTRGRSYTWYCVSAGFLVLGLLAKPMLVTLPLVLLLLDVWPLRRLRVPAIESESSDSGFPQVSWRVALLEKLLLMVIVAVAAVLTVHIQKQAGAMQGTFVFDLSVRLSNAMVAYVAYLGKLLWPFGLAPFYPHPYIVPPRTLSDAAVGTSVALLLALTIVLATLSWRARRAEWLIGWLWYLGTMVPVIGVIMVGEHALADRYAYVTFIGLYIVLVWGAGVMLDRFAAPRAVAGVLAAGVIVLLAARSIDQAHAWRNSIALFGHTLDVTQYNWKAHNSLADALIQASDDDTPSDRRERLLKSIEHTREALHLRPSYVEPMVNKADAHVALGQIGTALAIYERASETDPENAGLYCGWGIALAKLDRHDDAAEKLHRALEIAPSHFRATEALVEVYSAQGHYQDALDISEPTVAMMAAPSDTLLEMLAIAYAKSGRFDDAVRAAERALASLPRGTSPQRVAELDRRLTQFRAGRLSDIEGDP